MNNLKNILYKIIDVAMPNHSIKRKINGFSILIPARWSKYFKSDYESENMDYIKSYCKPNMLAFNIGAHLGFMSVSMAQLVDFGSKVYCFEPTPSTSKLLNSVIKPNHVANNVSPVNTAATSKKGILEFFLAADKSSHLNSMASKNHHSRFPLKINATSIDGIVTENNIQQTDLIKTDAEGSEYGVLVGGFESIKRFNRGFTIHYKSEKMMKEIFCRTSNFFDVQLSF